MEYEGDIQMRKTRFKQMSTKDLLEVHAAGILSSMAYDMLESELGERGVTVPPRPNGERLLAEVDEKKRSPSQHKFLILSIKEVRNMLDKLSEKNKKKMLLNIFVYYPLGLIIAFSVAIAILKWVGVMDDPPVEFIIFFLIIAIPIGIWQISQIYKDLLRKEEQKKDL
jgi:hypothetical protein